MDRVQISENNFLRIFATSRQNFKENFGIRSKFVKIATNLEGKNKTLVQICIFIFGAKFRQNAKIKIRGE
jgi:hypothetical protein